MEINAKDKKSAEYTFEKTMGGKLRTGALSQMRNGISVAKLGDKPYGFPEYSSNYYKLEGVVPGQSICNRPKTQSRIGATDFADLRSYAQINPNRMLWKDRVRKENIDAEIAEVEALPDS